MFKGRFSIATKVPKRHFEVKASKRFEILDLSDGREREVQLPHCHDERYEPYTKASKRSKVAAGNVNVRKNKGNKDTLFTPSFVLNAAAVELVRRDIR